LSETDTAKPTASGTVSPVPGQNAASLETRVAILEKIAVDTRDVLVEIKLDIREMRQEFKQEMRETRQEFKQEMREMRQEFKQDIKDLRSDQRSDFRINFGALMTVTIGLAGLMAHGFHWL
jgi:hypothetical protein